MFEDEPGHGGVVDQLRAGFGPDLAHSGLENLYLASYEVVGRVEVERPCQTCGGSDERHYEWGGKAGTSDPCPDCTKEPQP